MYADSRKYNGYIVYIVENFWKFHSRNFVSISLSSIMMYRRYRTMEHYSLVICVVRSLEGNPLSPTQTSLRMNLVIRNY